MAFSQTSENACAMKEPPDIKLAGEVIRIRLSQLLVNERYKKNEFLIPIHLALGHEAIAVAVAKNMHAKDSLVVPHRNIHYNLARIRTLKPLLNEYFLKPAGLAGGRLGSMNLANRKAGVVYASSILANNLGVAAGLALAKQIQKSNGVVYVVTGDGAMEEGSFYEALEFFRSHRLACIVIVENNQWSLATTISERRCPIDLKKLNASFGMPFISLTGNDVYAYAEQIAKLRRNVVLQRQPACVEVHLSTLGSWHMKTPECPNGKFINYHAGPSPSAILSGWPILVKSREDPVHVLCRRFSKASLMKTAEKLLRSLETDIQ